MKFILLLALAASMLFSSAKAQDGNASHNHRNFPIIITLQFHSLAMPFHQLNTNFKNIGIGIGTEISHAGNSNQWVQGFHALWYFNRAAGNGIMLYTQAEWRPEIVSNMHGGVKAGIGYTYAFRPVVSYKHSNGAWVSAGKAGKGMLAVPLGISLERNSYSHGTYSAPYIGYQFVLVKGYNETIPIVPNTILQMGTRVHTRFLHN